MPFSNDANYENFKISFYDSVTCCQWSNVKYNWSISAEKRPKLKRQKLGFLMPRLLLEFFLQQMHSATLIEPWRGQAFLFLFILHLVPLCVPKKGNSLKKTIWRDGLTFLTLILWNVSWDFSFIFLNASVTKRLQSGIWEKTMLIYLILTVLNAVWHLNTRVLTRGMQTVSVSLTGIVLRVKRHGGTESF